MDRVSVEAEIGALYEEYGGELAGYAVELSGSDELAAGAVQLTFLRYFAERSYGRTIEQPRVWMLETIRKYLLGQRHTFRGV